MANLIEIQAQIEALKKQAETIRTKEFATTVQEIRATMAAFGITAKDLQAPLKKRGRKAGNATAVKVKGIKVAKVKGSKAGVKVEAKFNGPNGEAWTGRGITPKWLSSLIAQGRTKEEFAVSPTSAPAAE